MSIPIAMAVNLRDDEKFADELRHVGQAFISYGEQITSQADDVDQDITVAQAKATGLIVHPGGALA